MVYHVSDGYTFSCTETRPIEYTSTEQALIDFEHLLTTNKKSFVEFAGHTFHYSDFYYHGDNYELPEFLTFDEWFEKYQ